MRKLQNHFKFNEAKGYLVGRRRHIYSKDSLTLVFNEKVTDKEVINWIRYNFRNVEIQAQNIRIADDSGRIVIISIPDICKIIKPGTIAPKPPVPSPIIGFPNFQKWAVSGKIRLLIAKDIFNR